MKRFLNIAVALLLVVLLVGYMVTYTVRFNEAAIVTTFGSIGEGSVKNAPGPEGRAGDDAGLHFKWPWPIQQVAATYDTRVQVVEGAIEQALTADNQSIAVQVFVTYRITDPLQFYKALGNPAEAANALRTRIRDSQGLVGNYTLSQLANVDPTRVRLDELGQRMRERIQRDVDDLSYGITILEAGVVKIVLPGPVTSSVFNRMGTERTALAQQARDEGQAEFSTLQSEATSQRDIILSFANVQADNIRQEGQQTASELYAGFGEDQDLAAFLAEIQTLRSVLAERARFFIDAEKLYPFTRLGEYLSSSPGQQQPQQDGGSVNPPAEAPNEGQAGREDDPTTRLMQLGAD